ncbi:hypothetical protein [Dapis sp. BLCC M126]
MVKLLFKAQKNQTETENSVAQTITEKVGIKPPLLSETFQL